MTPPPDHNGPAVRVDPADLIDKGKKLAELPSAANGLFDILNKLHSNLQSLGQPWGDDKLGKQFAEGASGYVAAVDSVVGNASTGSDASGAIPVFGQLLINYGATIQEAGKAFSAGEDLYAEWMLKNYVDEDAHGNPGPYKGPLSSDPNHGKTGDDNKDKNGGNNNGKDGGDKNSSGPPPPTKENQGSGGGPKPGGPDIPQPGGSNAGGSNPGGSNPGGVGLPGGATGPGDGQPEKPAFSSAPGTERGSSIDPLGLSPRSDGADLDAALNPGVGGLFGPLGPNGYRPSLDSITGAPVDKSGVPGLGGKSGAGGVPGIPQTRLPSSAFDGEKLAGKNGVGGVPSRAAMPGAGMMPPGMPGVPPGAQSGGPADGKGKRRKPASPAPEVEEPAGTEESWPLTDRRAGER
ncbi:hypothetical protein AB0M22_44225 [Nocardia sp. NPDC051756]|uniref:hypothetical protein n=1 Tax=Nocardia sp. NPDC051756 TaxID=3154751 RepID=UPI0034352E27